MANNPKYDNLSRIFHIFLTALGEGGGRLKRSAWPLFSRFFFDAFPKGRVQKPQFTEIFLQDPSILDHACPVKTKTPDPNSWIARFLPLSAQITLQQVSGLQKYVIEVRQPRCSERGQKKTIGGQAPFLSELTALLNSYTEKILFDGNICTTSYVYFKRHNIFRGNQKAAVPVGLLGNMAYKDQQTDFNGLGETRIFELAYL